MKVTAIIVEYNPFHKGHLYHINKAKEITNADFIIAIMSGNYVQRGEPAIVDKYSRTQMALSCGVDLVIELPTCYSTASAEYFALGAISIINKLGIVDSICFGSECGNIDVLCNIASILNNEPSELSSLLSELIKKGQSYPTARTNALYEYIINNPSVFTNEPISPSELNIILNSPNNILGIEYIKALLKLNSNIKPYTLTRSGSSYNQVTLSEQDTFPSASAIRNVINSSSNDILLKDIINYVPTSVMDIFKSAYGRTFPISLNDYYLLLFYKIQHLSVNELTDYFDVDISIANKIKNNIHDNLNYSALISSLKSKDITYLRISRCLLHILLDIKKDSIEDYLNNGITEYARILGFNTNSSFIIRKIKEFELISLITKPAYAKKNLSPSGMNMFNLDINATNLYNKIIYDKYNSIIKDEYLQGPIRYSS